MKAYIKYIVVTVVLIAVFAIVLISSKKGKESEATTVAVNTTSVVTTEENKDVVDKEDKKEETTVVDRETIYHKNVEIDMLLEEYNKTAEIKITPDMVRVGTYDVNANITVGDVEIILFNNEGSLTVDYSCDGKNDDVIYPIFRDLSKVINKKVTNKRTKRAWKEIKEGNYTGTSFYNMKGMQISYIVGEEDDGNNHYIVMTKMVK